VDSDGSSWQATLDINLRAALVGTRLAARAMIRQRTKGASSCWLDSITHACCLLTGSVVGHEHFDYIAIILESA
jgi:NAD(P)-dependent dehydrogenase (short-subunit alcohol dehydrogenase family)